MKKVMMYLFILVLVLAFVSCDSEVFNKLTDAMEIMNKNVYGIDPNLEAVDDAVEEATSGIEVTVDGEGNKTATELIVAGTTTESRTIALEDEFDLDPGELPEGINGDSPVADIDFSEENAEKIYESVAAIANSPGAKEAFIEKLKEPVADSNPEAVGNALKIQKEIVKKIAADLGGNDESILSSIESIIIPAAPTKGDMIVIQLLANLAKKTSDRASDLAGEGTEEDQKDAEEEILKEAFNTLETLKTIGGASSIDLVSLFNINELLDRSTSRDAAEDTFLTAIKNSVSSLIDEIINLSGISTEDMFTVNNVSQLINQFTGLRISYELLANAKNPVSWVEGEDNVEKLLSYDDFVKYDDGELELQDILLYAVSVGVTDLYNRIGATDFVALLNALIDNKEELQAAILSGDEIPSAIQDKLSYIRDTYKQASDLRGVDDIKQAFAVINTLLYMKWESGTFTSFDKDIEENLNKIFEGEDE